MNPRTVAARSAPLSFVAANEDQTPNAGISVDFQDLCSLAMDQALGFGRESLAPVVGFNSCLLDLYKDAFYIVPVLSNLSDAAAHAFAICVELEMGWVALLAPHASTHVSPVVSISASSHDQTTPDELAYSMDIALGERFAATSKMDAGNSGKQAQPTAEVLAQTMDVAIGERVAAPGSISMPGDHAHPNAAHGRSIWTTLSGRGRAAESIVCSTQSARVDRRRRSPEVGDQNVRDSGMVTSHVAYTLR